MYGCESRTIGIKVKRKLDSFQIWCYRKMLKIKWSDKITNEEGLNRTGNERCLHKWKKGRTYRTSTAV